jgi:5-methylcytosine-specific restriction endonuclease McrA
MRPVTKTGQGTYAPVVDMTHGQAALDNSLAAFNIPFGTKSVARIRAVWNTGTPTAKQVLDGLLLVATAPKVKKPVQPPAKKQKTIPSMTDKVKAIKDTLNSKLAKIYGTSAGPLEGQLGRFCSFCEHYYQSGLAVEHVVPKAPYPLFYLAWDNFLICCPVCNSNKSSKPPRNDALFTPKPADEAGYYTEIRANYLWPQWYSDVFRRTKPVFEYLDQGTWYVVDYPVQYQTELKNADKVTRTITADVYSYDGNQDAWYFDVPVRVKVTPNNDESTNMVNLVALNKPSSNDKKPGAEADIRLWSRTEHWFKVLEALTLLKDAKASQFDGFWKMMMMSVQQPGLYSVWVTVIDLLGPGGSWVVPNTTTSVMSKFLAQIVDQAYFPGTDTDNTP